MLLYFLHCVRCLVFRSFLFVWLLSFLMIQNEQTAADRKSRPAQPYCCSCWYGAAAAVAAAAFGSFARRVLRAIVVVVALFDAVVCSL